MLSDEKFYEKAQNFALLKTTDGKYFNYQEYKALIEPDQTDKNKKIVYLYTTDPVSQYSYIEEAKNKGYQVLIFDSQLDAHFVNLLESKFKDATFARVDADSIDALIQKDNREKPKLQEHEEQDLTYAMESIMPKTAHYNVQVENLGENSAPILITQSEFMRRYREMSSLNGGLNFYGEMPDSYTITMNYENSLIKKVMENKENLTSAKLAENEKTDAENTKALDALN